MEKEKRLSFGMFIDDLIGLQKQYPGNKFSFCLNAKFELPVVNAYGYMSGLPYFSTPTAFTNKIEITIDKPRISLQFDLSSGNYQAIVDAIAALLENYSLS